MEAIVEGGGCWAATKRQQGGKGRKIPCCGALLRPIASVGLLDRLDIDRSDCECQFYVLNGSQSLTYHHPVDMVIADTFTIRFAALRFRGWDLFGNVRGRFDASWSEDFWRTTSTFSCDIARPVDAID